MTEMHKTSWLYKFLRTYTNFIYGSWYSSTEVNNDRVIPKHSSVIFAPNHQNAFVDAMALLWASPEPIVFLAKASIFTRKFIKKALNGLKIMPAYRMRDGYANLKKNEESFNEAVNVLAHNEYFCLMPEGGQDEKRRLRPLVKGMFRIAFAAQKLKPEGESVLIIPTGIDYGHYDHSGFHLVINYGKPIRIADYYAEYLENEAVTQNKVRDELYNRMKALILHISSEKYYDTFYAATYIYNSEMLDAKGWSENESNRLAVRQKIAAALDKAEAEENPLLPELDKKVKQWLSNVEDDMVELYSVANEYPHSMDFALIYNILYLLISLLVVIPAFVLSGLPRLLFQVVARKLAYGTGFEGSLKLGFVYVLLPLFYLIEILLFIALRPPYVHIENEGIWVLLAFIVSLPLSFLILQNFSRRFRIVKARLKTIFKMGKIADEIKEIMRKIVPEI
ncbi:MAG: 1-acyl-sn-glycerol-3-phosphate acyltransferase [Paludibacteraceae bacterium]|nr:1-acyl-sn-glycerol-3-phosphate acyltransferase [Paludibacteraceae bacterium]